MWRGDGCVGGDGLWTGVAGGECGGLWTWRSDGREWAMACHTWMVRKPLAAANAPRNEVMITCKPGGVRNGAPAAWSATVCPTNSAPPHPAAGLRDCSLTCTLSPVCSHPQALTRKLSPASSHPQALTRKLSPGTSAHRWHRRQSPEGRRWPRKAPEGSPGRSGRCRRWDGSRGAVG